MKDESGFAIEQWITFYNMHIIRRLKNLRISTESQIIYMQKIA